VNIEPKESTLILFSRLVITVRENSAHSGHPGGLSWLRNLAIYALREMKKHIAKISFRL